MPNWIRRTLYIIFLLLILGLSYLIVQDFQTIIPNYSKITQIYGLKYLSEKDIKAELSKLELNDKSLLENNSLKIAHELEKNPLIQKAKVRHFKYPKLKSKIFIEETNVWAYYGMLILDDKAEVIATLDDRSLSQRTLDELYTIKSELIRIESVSLISNAELKTLRDLAQMIEHALLKADIETKLVRIKGDIEDNYIFYTDKYIFKLGLLDENVFTRVKRMEHVTDAIKDLEKSGADLEYFDLSLTTSDVIVGKKSGTH